MKARIKPPGLFYTLLVAFTFCACSGSGEKQENVSETKDVEFVTSAGTIVIRLYDETPQHRDNFLKLAGENFYDSILFHRVIENFMIQGGDPESKGATLEDTLGRGGLDYKVPAEFLPNIFHKRGALGAARDGNPERASSATQFYIVQGRVYTDSLLEAQEVRINGWLSMNRVVNDSANKSLVDKRRDFYDRKEWDSARAITDQLEELSEIELANSEKYVIPPEHREVYKIEGGAAHLDQNYTVFGEVVKGMDVVDQIAASATNDLDRPVEDVRILQTRLIDRKSYE